MNKRGIIYVATGPRYMAEAVLSANSVQAVMPGFPMTLFTDQTPPAGLFENVFAADPAHKGRVAKIRSMAASPYAETLFLDTDTFMCESCEDIFWPLQKYDIAVAHEVYRNEYRFESFPDSFPALNTGVVVFSRNTKTQAFFNMWEESYLNVFRHKQPADQPAFRHTLFQSDLLHYILPAEFNFRTNYPVVLGGFASAKIIHDRNPYIRDLATLLGHDTGHPPVYFGPIFPRYFFAWCWLRSRTLCQRAKSMSLGDLWKRLTSA
jgi:hypothetical protein